MNIERYLRLVAGVFILASVLAAHFISPLWLLFTLFVGANLIQSAFTGTCPMVWILRKAGVPSCGETRQT
jgi:Protein of unknown function (DUF2892)